MKKYILMVVTFIVTLTVNAIANIIPFNQISTAEVSLKYPSYFTPENYVFSIWGVIYLALGLMLVYLGLNYKKYVKYIDKVSTWFILASLLNAVWMFTWHYEFLAFSVMVMGMLLLSLIYVYLITKEFRSKLPLVVTFAPSIYLGWISVATVANISSFLAFRNFSFVLSDVTYAVIMIYVALLLGLAMIKFEKDYVYASVILWAVVGILVKFSTITEIMLFGTLGLIAYLLVAFYLSAKTLKKKK